VSRYDGKSFTHFTENEGLNNISVQSIIEAKIQKFHIPKFSEIDALASGLHSKPMENGEGE
jgi:hypothetical protein